MIRYYQVFYLNVLVDSYLPVYIGNGLRRALNICCIATLVQKNALNEKKMNDIRTSDEKREKNKKTEKNDTSRKNEQNGGN